MAPIVTSSYGQLEGIDQGRAWPSGGSVRSTACRGLRWGAPEPPVAWDGVREATATSAISPQVINEALESVLPSGDATEPQSEDCLYLNVFTPALDDAKRPTLVWIHGARSTLGSGASPMYDGTVLVERGDVVVVTINYRLGALGFLQLPATDDDSPSTNFGMLDQVAALYRMASRSAARTPQGAPERQLSVPASYGPRHARTAIR